ncbi:MAG: methylenetetrahydrofolate reductase [Planctomycetes bacterium DG_23]|nr:MAG: methylenetetrahydrofolate reductase [Planctomycetes bacterium DG_23]
MSNLSESLADGKFTVTGEIGPPKGVDTDEMFHEAEYYKGVVAAVNVTDIQSSVMRLGSMAVCHQLLDMGIEPVFQMTCRDRNRLAMQSDLLSAYVLGIRNVLAITGDHVALGDHPQAMPVFELDSVQLLKVIAGLEAGKDMAGNDLAGAPEFFKGAVVTPCADPVEPQIIKLEKKVAAGAQFIQTQAVYEPGRFEEFMKKVEHIDVPILVGIVLLKSAGMAKYMNANVAGVVVPDEMMEEMASVAKEDRQKKSVEIAARLIREMRLMCQGAHIMPLGWDSLVPQVLKEAELL